VNILKETIPTIGKIVLYKAELDETYWLLESMARRTPTIR
jgi:hypothetical protein